MKSQVKQHHAYPRKLLCHFLFFCMLAGIFLLNKTVSAGSSRPASITSCQISGSDSVCIRVSLKNPRLVSGSNCYLFALDLYHTRPLSTDRPIAVRKKASQMVFTCSLNASKSNTRLYSGFVVASRNKNGTYTVISNKRFISNPQKIAKYRDRFPTSDSKKGLQVNPEMMEDAVELNVKNSVINITFSQLIAYPNQQNSTYSYAYRYQGKTYWFLKNAVHYYDKQLQALKATGSVNSAIILLDWRSDLKHLIYPAGREPGHAFYAWNTVNTASCKQLQAALTFLARRYSPSNGKYGRIVNWIIGNEVNNYKTYHYAGNQSLNQYAKIYADNFRLAYNCITSVYANARLYISLDHLWNTNYVNGTFASKKMLDAFAYRLRADGNISWNLAYHPYSSPLTEPRFWANTNGQVTNSLSSPVINMANIHILTDYIKKNYGSRTRIILSEQGYTSLQKSHNTETLQAAAIAYTYLLAEADNMIDSVIIHRHVDHQAEINQGLNLGLWTTNSAVSAEWASSPKQSWNVFKYMDTNLSANVTKFGPSAIGVSNWTDLIPNYNQKLYSKISCYIGKMYQVKSYKKTASISPNWQKYGASVSLSKAGNTFRVLHDGRRNANSLWGFTQTFPKGLNFNINSAFYTTLRIDGAQRNTVQVKFRFYSGRKIFECKGTIPSGRATRLKIPLTKWKYKNRVTKIQITVAPINQSGWNSNATISMSIPVRGR